MLATQLKKRNAIIFKKVCGERACVDNSVCNDWTAGWPSG